MAEYKPCLTCYHMAVCYKIEHYGRDIHSKIPCDLYMSIVDTETVVRCKDCKYFQTAKVNNKGFLICPTSGMEITETDYCSYGERKEESNDQQKT